MSSIENIRIKLITYNVGDKSADQNRPDHLFNFVQLRKFDFVFIGLQEVVCDSGWTSMIKKSFSEHDYVMLKLRNIWAIWIYVLVKRTRLPFIDCVESETTASGYAGVMGNKGGVSIRFKYHGISFVVVNAHFTAHEEGLKDRLNDYLDIISTQSFRDPDVDNLLDHDIVFWMGDLNFRIENLGKEVIEKNIQNKNYDILIKNDQLINAMKSHNIFIDFKEGDLTFPPTFKFDDDVDVYDTSKKKRKPAWTDRILYMTHDDGIIPNKSIELLKYYSEVNVRGSDHRPVCAEFKISVHPDKGFKLPIQFTEITEAWDCDEDHLVTYKSIGNVESESKKNDNVDYERFSCDSWDWIGLLPKNWTILLEDYITYVYAPCVKNDSLQELASVEFSKRYLNSIGPETELQLVYFSKKKNCIQGLSNTFSIKKKKYTFERS